MRSLFFGSHVATRLLFGLILAALLVSGHTALLLVVSTLMVVLIDAGWSNIARALRVLRWFVLPILLLHLIFSGGERIWPESGLPFSLEGLKAGVMLSLHLLTFYSLAMLLSRLLLRDEMLAVVASLPVAGRRLYPYTLSMYTVRSVVQSALNEYRSQFQLRRHWLQAGVMLASLLQQVLATSSTCSALLWLRWPAGSHGGFGCLQWRRELPVLMAGGIVLGVSWLI